ncbi:uncharacterized protein LOC144440653 [Glandiceps talaboti]
MAVVQGIPVIDFDAYSLSKDRPSEDNLQRLADEVYNAFSTIGFVYLENHGIQPEKVKQVFEVSRRFYSLPRDVKMKCALQPKGETPHGYIPIEGERTNPTFITGDLKECFNYLEKTEEKAMPDEELPEFREVMTDFFKICSKLTLRILEVFAKALKLDPLFFAKTHECMVGGKNDTTLRTAYYPPVTGDFDIKEGQERCGEHSDFGSLTLLFQDDVGGLEVMNLDGQYVKATPVEGTVLVNLGDLMQRWTADTLKSAKHRVVMPQTDDDKQKARQSVIFFVHPDCDVLIECTDGSNKYPPITAEKYLYQKLDFIY